MKNTKAFKSICESLLLITSLFMASCSLDAEDSTVTEYSFDDIYGYTFQCSFTSSSGTALSPAIILYNSDRLDWNMSTTGMGNNQYVYTAVQTAVNNWTTYWYSGSTLADAEELKSAGDTSQASMIVRLGIDSRNQVTCLVKSAKDGAGDSMGVTPLSMTKTSAGKNTTPTDWLESTYRDTLISIPDDAESAEWPETNETTTYSGSFVYLVKGANKSGDGATGDDTVPSVIITKTDNNTVTITNVKMHVTDPLDMTVMPFELADVAVKKDGDIYYLTAGNLTSQTSDYTEDESGNKLTGYKVKVFSVAGKLEKSVLTLRIVFKPGSMPFYITEIFTSEN